MTIAELTDEQKSRLREVYEKSRDNTLQHDVAYMVKMKPAAFDKLVESSEPKVQYLGRSARVIRQFIVDCETGVYSSPASTMNAFTAVLLYLVNPFDLIPDTVPNAGYSDDLYMLELALETEKTELLRYIETMNIDVNLAPLL